jgi:Na+-transporting methylmalonyl-CoA/oxaloacetate decarboxylase gamma subunit
VDNIQAILGAVLLLIVGVAVVLLLVILVLVETHFILNSSRRLLEKWRAKPAMAESGVGSDSRTPEYATTGPNAPTDTSRRGPLDRSLGGGSHEEVGPSFRPDARGYPPTEPEPPAIKVFTRAQMDPEVLMGSLSTVAVTVSRERISRIEQPHDVGGEAEATETRSILIEVIPRINVEVVGRNQIETEVPREDEPRLFTFRVRGTHLGEGEAWALVRQGQVPLVTLVLRFRIVRALASNSEGSATAEGIATAPTIPPRPLRLLRIIEQRLGDTVIFRYDLEAPDLRLLHAFASRPIQQSRDKYVRQLFRRIEDCWLSSQEDTEAFHEQLRAFGADLLDELIPLELQLILWDYRDRLGQILVLSTEPFIPWELVHLKDPSTRILPDEDYFLGQMGLVRWQWGSWPPEQLIVRPGRVFHIIPDYPDPRYQLSETGSERRYLERILDAKPMVAHHREVLKLLRTSGAFDLLHLAGHGRATSEDIADAQMLLEGRLEHGRYIEEPLRASMVAHHFDADQSVPIVILNACQTGRLGYQLASIGGFAEAFIRGGAGAFISSLWSVGDRPARVFVQTFYEALLSNSTMAEAATIARSAARASGDATWLAYTVYAHPNAQLQRV